MGMVKLPVNLSFAEEALGAVFLLVVVVSTGDLDHVLRSGIAESTRRGIVPPSLHGAEALDDVDIAKATTA